MGYCNPNENSGPTLSIRWEPIFRRPAAGVLPTFHVLPQFTVRNPASIGEPPCSRSFRWTDSSSSPPRRQAPTERSRRCAGPSSPMTAAAAWWSAHGRCRPAMSCSPAPSIAMSRVSQNRPYRDDGAKGLVGPSGQRCFRIDSIPI